MLVVEKAKALALKLNNPNRVLDSIQGDGRVWWLRLSWEWGL